MKYLGHKNPENGQEQPLLDHLQSVSKKAGFFASTFSEEATGHLVGLYHDIGKYSVEFQNYLQAGGGKKVDHSTAGALELWNRRISGPGAFCIAGHHAGLPDGGNRIDSADEKTLYGRMKRKPNENIPEYRAYRDETIWPEESIPSTLLSTINREDDFARQFYVRMIFSCLV